MHKSSPCRIYLLTLEALKVHYSEISEVRGGNMRILYTCFASSLCVATLFVYSPTMLAQQPDPGCELIGSSACGGDDHGQCKPQERFYSERCSGGRVVNKCMVDPHCASVTKGRFNIAGTWTTGRPGSDKVTIRQLADSLTINGSSFVQTPAEFIGPQTIQFREKNGSLTTGTIVSVYPNTQTPNRINWSNGVFWQR